MLSVSLGAAGVLCTIETSDDGHTPSRTHGRFPVSCAHAGVLLQANQIGSMWNSTAAIVITTDAPKRNGPANF